MTALNLQNTPFACYLAALPAINRIVKNVQRLRRPQTYNYWVVCTAAQSAASALRACDMLLTRSRILERSAALSRLPNRASNLSGCHRMSSSRSRFRRSSLPVRVSACTSACMTCRAAGCIAIEGIKLACDCHGCSSSLRHVAACDATAVPHTQMQGCHAVLPPQSVLPYLWRRRRRWAGCRLPPPPRSRAPGHQHGSMSTPSTPSNRLFCERTVRLTQTRLQGTWPYATSDAAAGVSMAAKACQRASYRARRTPWSPCTTHSKWHCQQFSVSRAWPVDGLLLDPSQQPWSDSLSDLLQLGQLSTTDLLTLEQDPI
jgi:hypothetical protein